MKKILKKVWTKIKGWFYALLVAIGIAVPVMAAVRDFSYTPATEYVDGTPMPLSHIAETRLYCNGDPTPVAVEPGADGDFSVLLPPGSYNCQATHVTTNGEESDLSNTTTFEVLPEAAPKPPATLQVN